MIGGIDINIFDNYNDIKNELKLFKQRLKLIEKYEKKVNYERKTLNEIIVLQTNLLHQIEDDIKKLSGIENELYCEIVVNGIKVSKAIEKIATEENISVSTLWKNYYPSVKKRINALNLILSNENKENILN